MKSKDKKAQKQSKSKKYSKSQEKNKNKSKGKSKGKRKAKTKSKAKNQKKNKNINTVKQKIKKNLKTKSSPSPSSSSSSDNYRINRKGRVNSEGLYSKDNSLKLKKKKVKEKSNSSIKIINEIENNYKSHDLDYMNYMEKDIEKDGNCYYRCLSYYYRNTQEYHLEFRKLISEIFENNLDRFIDNYPDNNILGIPEPKNKEEILNLLKLYAQKMKEPDFYAGDHELILTSYYLNININVLIQDTYCYKSIYYYESPQLSNEIINLLYINGNHYQLLYNINDKDLESENSENVNKVDIKDYIKEKNKEIKKNKKK